MPPLPGGSGGWFAAPPVDCRLVLDGLHEADPALTHLIFQLILFCPSIGNFAHLSQETLSPFSHAAPRYQLLPIQPGIVVTLGELKEEFACEQSEIAGFFWNHWSPASP